MKSFLTINQLKNRIQQLNNLIGKFPTIRSLVRKWGFELVQLEGQLETLNARKPEPKQLTIWKVKTMILTVKNDELYAVSQDGKFIGKVINSISGGCRVNPPYDEPGTFDQVFGGSGYIYHQDDNPPNPFFNRSWREVFENPGLLPEGTRNVFIDQSHSCLVDFQSVPVAA